MRGLRANTASVPVAKNMEEIKCSSEGCDTVGQFRKSLHVSRFICESCRKGEA
jgi:transposase-like protein